MTTHPFGAHTPAPAQDHTIESIDKPEVGKIYPSSARPMKVAAEINNEVFNDGKGNSTVVFWRNTWWIHQGTRWEPVEEIAIRGPMYRRLEEVTYKKGDEIHDWAPTPAKISNILEPLAIQNHRPQSFHAPAWLTEDHLAPENNIIPLRNCLFDYTTGATYPHTATLFNTWSLNFDLIPNATCPQWEKFINSTFAHDSAARFALQEWFGYAVSGRTDLQKGLILIGPGGSGKGIMDRILQTLMGGTSNVAATSVQALSTNFGLSSWVGKPLAVFSDSRDSGAIPDAVVSRLLSVIGEDAVPIDIKQKDPISAKLPTRVMIVSNEIPSFRDSSGALVKRWVVIETAVSHRDNPDIYLEDRLRSELPGIFLWALEGLRRLEKQGNFTVPGATAETIEMMTDAAAQEAMFLKENYHITGDPEDYEWLSDVYADYELWVSRRGNRAVSQNRLKGKIKASGLTGVRVTKRERDGTRKEVISGISKTNFKISDSTDSTQLDRRFHTDSIPIPH